jgi:hypothetical protein
VSWLVRQDMGPCAMCHNCDSIVWQGVLTSGSALEGKQQPQALRYCSTLVGGSMVAEAACVLVCVVSKHVSGCLAVVPEGAGPASHSKEETRGMHVRDTFFLSFSSLYACMWAASHVSGWRGAACPAHQ